MARILIIDDEKNIRKMVRLALLRNRHAVETAPDGWQGLAVFGDGTGWDLTLVDQRMPLLSGLQFVRAARGRAPRARIIIMTSYGTLDLAGTAMSAGAIDFLRKPFSSDTLRSAVKAALRIRKEERPRGSSEIEDDWNLQELRQIHRKHAHQFPDADITLQVNGYTIHRLHTLPAIIGVPPAFDIYRVFKVQNLLEDTAPCVVGFTPHIEESVQQKAKGRLDASDGLWDLLCEAALTDYLAMHSEPPPVILTIYELTPRQREIASGIISSRQSNG